MSKLVVVRKLLLIVCGLSFSQSSLQAQDAPYIAGTIPYQRPSNAPSIDKFEKNADWYAKALTGIDKPYPNSLLFLDDQGSWYTPFTVPGMVGRYDIRQWHP
jgi:hypothetical protein